MKIEGTAKPASSLEEALSKLARLAAQGKMDPGKAIQFVVNVLRFRQEVWPNLTKYEQGCIRKYLRRMRDG